jgi:galactokinase
LFGEICSLRCPNRSKSACKLSSHVTSRPECARRLFDGNVPSGGGLSSSAAMTCTSVIAALKAFGALDRFTKQRITNLAVSAEHLCSISCGGMDQAASIFGQRGGMAHVDFVPELTASPLKLPASPSVDLVVSNSLVVADKHLTSKFNYNLRLVEVRVAAALLAKHLKLDLPIPTTLRRVQLARNKGKQPETTAMAIEELEGLLEEAKTALGAYEEGITWDEVLHQLGDLTQDQFKQRFHPSFEIETERLQVMKRARHSLNEAKRVLQFKQLLETPDGTDEDGRMQRLGELMYASHASCRDDYACSCPELDQLVDLGRTAGSLGSRVAGAGFGGSVVHLVLSKDVRFPSYGARCLPPLQVPTLIQTLREEYYNGLSVATVNEALFSSVPGTGAFVLQA